jgi:hypothetical protein
LPEPCESPAQAPLAIDGCGTKLMNTTYFDYLTIARDTARSIETIKRQPMVARETDYYLKKIGQIKTAEEFVSDRRLLT